MKHILSFFAGMIIGLGGLYGGQFLLFKLPNVYIVWWSLPTGLLIAAVMVLFLLSGIVIAFGELATKEAK